MAFINSGILKMSETDLQIIIRWIWQDFDKIDYYALGFPVLPEVYKINNGSSAFIISAGQYVLKPLIASSKMISVGAKSSKFSVLFITNTFLMLGKPSFNASCTVFLNGTVFPPLTPLKLK